MADQPTTRTVWVRAEVRSPEFDDTNIVGMALNEFGYEIPDWEIVDLPEAIEATLLASGQSFSDLDALVESLCASLGSYHG